MKKLLCLLCSLGMLLLTGCSLLWPSSSQEEGEPLDTNKYLKEFAGSWCYQRLDFRLQDCYRAVYTAVRDGFFQDEAVTIADSGVGSTKEYVGVKVKLPQPLYSQKEIHTLYTAFTWDHPAFFYVGNTYGYEGRKENKQEYYTALSLSYTMNAGERATASRRLEQVIGHILNSLKSSTKAFDRELLLHDTLVAKCRYDDTAAKSENPAVEFPNAFTAYGALVEGKAVCEGYSRAMQLLLHRANMESTLVNGTGKENGVSHMWNIVTIDGRNYHLDATWNDTDDLPRHNYFNLTTEDIQISHTIDLDNFGVDTCSATQANYYRYTHSYVDVYSLNTIANIISQQILAGKTMVELRFSPTHYANGAAFIGNPDYLTKKVNALLAPQKKTMWSYRVDGEPDEHILRLYKK